MSMTLKGFSDVFNALQRVQKEFAKARRIAFTRIAFKVKADAVKNAPIDTGNLRASAFSTITDDFAQVGFSAHYAASVHEMVGQKLKGQPRADFGTTKDGQGFGGGSGKGTYWQSGGPKYLERAVQSNEQFILDELKKAAPK